MSNFSHFCHPINLPATVKATEGYCDRMDKNATYNALTTECDCTAFQYFFPRCDRRKSGPWKVLVGVQETILFDRFHSVHDPHHLLPYYFH